MLYSGVNIFGTLTNLYLSSKDQYSQAALSGGQTQQAQPMISSGTQDALQGASSNSMMQLSNEVLSIFKKMQKRDSITKIKALQELQKYVDALEADSEELPNLLTFFLYHMCRILLNEPDKLVREAAHDSFTSFIRKAKRKLGPHIKKIFPLWYCAFFDPSPEVARLASSNFELAFPVDKQPEVFQLSYKMFLHFANEQLQQSDEDMSGVSSQDKKANEAISDRLTCSLLQALANSFNFVKKWSVEDQKQYQRKLLDIFSLSVELNQTAPTTKGKGSKSKASYIWSFLSPKVKGSIKGACLQFVAAFITEMPAEIVQQHIKDIAPAVFGLVSDENPILQTTFWREALFTLAKRFPECWSSIQIKKDFLPKLYKCLKDGAFGAPTSLYENFVKYLSVCPLYKLTDFAQSEDKNNKASFKDRCNLIRELMLNLYSAMQNDEAVQFHQELVNSYCESLTFLLLKRVATVEASADQDFAMKQMEKVITTPLIDFIEHYLKGSKYQKARNIRSSFQSRFCQVFVDLAERGFNPDLFKQVCQIVNKELSPSKRNSMRFLSQLVELSKKLPSDYRQIVYTSIIAEQFNTQVLLLSKQITELSKTNIGECTQIAQCHRRLIYTIVKKQDFIDESQFKLLKVGEMLTTVLKKEQMARNVLSTELQTKFKDLEQCLLDISILYLAQKFEISEEFTKVLVAVGLLEVSELEASKVKVDPLEQTLFSPDFPKVNLTPYFETLQTCASTHDLIVGAVSIKMLAENSVVEYMPIVQKVIEESVNIRPNAILNQEDLELIRTQVVQQLTTEGVPIEQLTAYFQSVQALCVNQDEVNEEFRLLLIDKLIEMRIDSRRVESSFDKIWTVFVQSASDNLDFQVTVISRLQDAVGKLIQTQAEISSFTHLTKVIGLFISLRKDKVETLAEILLKEVNFSKLETNCLPIKMFKDLFLQGGIGFNVQELFTNCKTEQGKYKYVWLAATFLGIRHLTSVSSLIELRRQLLIFVETEVLPAIIFSATSEEHRQFVVQVFEYLSLNGQLHTFEFLAKTMTDPGEQYADLKPVLKIDDFKQIYQNTVSVIAEQLIQSNFEVHPKQDFLVVSLQTISYYLLDEPSVKGIFKLVDQNLQSLQIQNLKQCKIQLEVYMALEKWLGSGDQQTQQFQMKLLNNLLQLESIEMKQIAITICNMLLDRQSVAAVKAQANTKDLLSTILELLEYTGEVDCQNTITLCKVIRKTLDWSQASDSIVSVLVQAAKDRAQQFDAALKNVSQVSGALLRQFEIEMLQEFAETLLVCPLTLTEHTLQPSIEDNLYYLMGCGFEALQKAAFVLMKYIYQNFIPPVEFLSNEEEDLKNLMSRGEEESKVQVHSTAERNLSANLLRIIDEAPSTEEDTEEFKHDTFNKNELESLIFGTSEEGQMNNKVFGYLLVWNAMLTKIEQGRIKCQLTAETSVQSQSIQYLQVLSALTEYLETDPTIYQMLLVSLIPYLPKITKKAQQDSFSQDFYPEYCDLRDPKQTRMICLLSLINFMKCFPSLGRKFFQENDRNLQEVILPYIKSVVSPAILENEIKKIEMSQLELGANSDLTFVLFKSTKEVVATYAKSAEFSCQLKLKIPHDYPLKSVVVDIGEQLKLKQTQIRKWTLSIRNLLQSRNGDIISAILLWKGNIDKEMQGIEECFICYSVMHQTDKSLPSMQCKNCKNKFHVACIRKWFNTSNKSNCPLCQTFFFQ